MAIKYGRPLEPTVRFSPVEPFAGRGASRSTSPRATAATANPSGRGAWCGRTCSQPTT